ncbi:MAG: carbonic anhydrase [Parasphingorhabdus sp.]|jgi:carbonic anhydrase|uniref:carbonic anhydrase n=1 Tax=Parasphingorhabdus sp. TaxID=2709688 RepID=UPI001B3FEFEF|nr:carbonic anhydrase [Parasphingorhabdus sp.]MBQ0772468.1 carbonic anhydrase [Sphingomonadales bacterium]|tara:strand:+ start:4430 stop:5071 length:642 start_codon:yes stop_codon:yes gene_type:complete
MTKFTDLLDGYRRFRSEQWKMQRERWDELKEGQSPKVMIIACSDSRVDPTQIFDTNPGETFIVRNVAALVPPFETTPGQHGVSAALEFAVQFLKVDEVVVMGHGSCGGCAAALSEQMKDMPHGKGGFIADWITLLDDARAKVADDHGDLSGAEAQLAMEHEGIRTSLANLRTFPCIQEKEADGSIRLIGAWFAIAEGKLHVLDQESDTFSAVD